MPRKSSADLNIVRLPGRGRPDRLTVSLKQSNGLGEPL
jgi:hypothetical protein